MPTDPVAWGVDNGMHTPELYRVLAHLAGEGEEGVLGLADLKVTPLTVPGAGVNVAVGVGIIPCRATGLTYQSYVGRVPTLDTVGVTATGAGAGRTDLIAYVVENPYVPGVVYTPPADPAVGPYAFVRAYANVGAAGTLPAPVTNKATAKAWLAAQGLSAIPLGLVVLPVSTAAVTAGMITDLRDVARPRRLRRQYASASGGVANLTQSSIVAPNWQDWAASTLVDVPAWATSVIVTAAARARLDRSSTTVNGTAVGNLRIRLGGTAAAPIAMSQTVAYDEFAPFADPASRIPVEVSDTIAVPAALRGQNGVTLALQGNRIVASSNKNLYVDTSSFVRLDYEWQESAT